MAVLNVLFSKLLKFGKGTSDRNAVRTPTREENISRALGKVEPYVVWLQSILIWENPVHTLVAYFCFNALFWLAVSLNIRFYFLLFSTTLVVLIYEMWVEKVWPEIRVPRPAEQGDNEGWTPLHPRVLSAPELSHYLNKVMQIMNNQYIWLTNLRHNQPGLFCAIMSIGCLLLMWIGRTVSGTTLLYIVFMSLLFIPGICIHVLPSASQIDWQGQLLSNNLKDDESDVDEYLPEPSGSNLVLLERAVQPDHSDHEDEEDFNIPPTELLHVDDMTDSGAMPAHEDLSLDGADFSFDIPQPSGNIDLLSIDQIKNKNQTASPVDLDVNSSDSDESMSPPANESAGIHFQNRHFKRDSSSEEENGPSRSSDTGKNMKSSNSTRKGSSGAVADAAAAVLSYSSAGALNLASLGASVGQSLISSVISSATPAQNSRSAVAKEEAEADDSLSDTDDFEMISEEEFANM